MATPLRTDCEGGPTPRTPNEKYRDAHVWYDREKKDSFGAYKLLIVDIEHASVVLDEDSAAGG